MKSSTKTKKKRSVAEAIVRLPGEQDVVNANQYVTSMLAASLGLKLCDAGRRILMYTKPHHANKGFYAIARGLFPIQELCGTITALNLARRDLLGVHTPLWKLLGPAVAIHGMASYRGMKVRHSSCSLMASCLEMHVETALIVSCSHSTQPIFKWNSSTPWSEMQLINLNVPDASTLPQLLSKGFGKLMWLVVIGRVLGYCIKNYYLLNRQAMKRTTTYAGNHAAFSAELATTEMLKVTRKK
jgi:hypothetical protein